jgi:type III restriction enzyme
VKLLIGGSDQKLINALTLYEREESARSTNLESKMADWLASAENIRWWHRNHQTRGFNLNGSINHYPDFIARTQSNTLVLIETKGEYLKNDDSDTKVELGNGATYAHKKGGAKK